MSSHFLTTTIGKGLSKNCSGTKGSGMNVHIMSKKGRLIVYLYHNPTTGEDNFVISMDDNPKFGGGSGKKRTIMQGVLDNSEETYND